jgi:HEAT repeat protein
MPGRWAEVAFLGGLCALIALAAPTSQAQNRAPDEDAETLRYRVEHEGGLAAIQAAEDLFTEHPEDDPFLRAVIENTEGRYNAEARLAVLRALTHYGRRRPQAACEIAYEAVADGDPQVASQAIQTLSAIEDETTYLFVADNLVDARFAGPNTPRGRKALALVEVLERMRNPIRSTGVLVTALEFDPSRALEQRVREVLQRLTARHYDSATEWRAWYDLASQRSLAEWRSEVALQHTQQLNRYEAEAERFFSRLLTVIGADQEALRRELSEALVNDSVPAVKRTAVIRLGDLAQRGDQQAAAVLRGRLDPDNLEYGEIQALAIQELGRTQDPSLLEVLLPYVEPRHHHRTRGSAVVALGRLRDPRGVPPLLEILRDIERTPDELRELVTQSLGQIGHNPDGLVSRTLIDLAREHLVNAGNGHAPAASRLLTVTAEALGFLPVTPNSEHAGEVATFLARQAGPNQQDDNVRSYAATALGNVTHPAVFPALATCLASETVPRVQKSLIGSLGVRALAAPERRPEAISAISPYIASTGPGVARKARQALEPLCTSENDPAFTLRELLVQSLLQAGHDRDLAASFLGGLPEASQVPAPYKASYLNLLEVRAVGRRETEPAAALSDATTLNAEGRNRAAFNVAVSCLPLPAAEGPVEVDTTEARAAWTVVTDAVVAILRRDQSQLPGLREALEPSLPTAPLDVRRRLEDVMGGS